MSQIRIGNLEKWSDLYIEDAKNYGLGNVVLSVDTAGSTKHTVTVRNGDTLQIRNGAGGVAAAARSNIGPQHMYSPHRELHEAKSAMERDTHNELRIVRRLRCVSPAFRRAMAVQHVRDLAVAVATAQKISGGEQRENLVDQLFDQYAFTMLSDFN